VTKVYLNSALIDISFCGKSSNHDEVNVNPRGGRIASFRSMSRENSQIKPQEKRIKIPNYLDCDVSKMIEMIMSHGFQDFTGHDDMVHKVANLIYNWAFEVIIIEDG